MKYKAYNKQIKAKKVDKVVASTLSAIVCLIALGGVGYYTYTQFDKLNKEKQEVQIKLDETLQVNTELQAENEQLKQETEAIKTELAEIKTQLEEKQAQVTTLTEQKTELLSTVTELDNKINSTTDETQLETLTIKKTAILNKVEDLNSQISSLETEINTLDARVDELELQLATYETYTLNIDTTNNIESITIEDTKLGTSATLTNLEISTLELFSWQNATITYAQNEQNSIYATMNGSQLESNVVTITGSENKGASVQIGSVIEENEEITLASYIGEYSGIKQGDFKNEMLEFKDGLFMTVRFTEDMYLLLHPVGYVDGVLSNESINFGQEYAFVDGKITISYGSYTSFMEMELINKNTLNVSMFDGSCEFTLTRTETIFEHGDYCLIENGEIDENTYFNLDPSGGDVYYTDGSSEVNGAFRCLNNKLYLLLGDRTEPVECDIVENGFIFEGKTYIYYR